MEQSEILESKDSNTDNASTDQQVETHTETDDDTPIEVIKEMNPGKTKRDYSRKKTEKEEAAGSPAETEGVVSNKSEYSDEIGSDNSQGSTDKKSLSRRFRNEGWFIQNIWFCSYIFFTLRHDIWPRDMPSILYDLSLCCE